MRAALLLAACMLPLSGLAQFPTEPPKGFPRVVEYACKGGEKITVSYSPKEGEHARVIAPDGMWKVEPVAGSGGAKFVDATAKVEWTRKGPEGTLSELGTGKVLKACTIAAGAKKGG